MAKIYHNNLLTLQTTVAPPAVFSCEEAGKLEGVEAKIAVDLAVPPKFCRARTVSHAPKLKVEVELKHLQQTGIIETMQ